MKRLLTLALLACLCAVPAHAIFSGTLYFEYGNFISSGSNPAPQDPIAGSITGTFDMLGSAYRIQALSGIDLMIDGHTYLLSEVTPVGDGTYLGAIVNLPEVVVSGTDDFLLWLNPNSSSTPSAHYATSSIQTDVWTSLSDPGLRSDFTAVPDLGSTFGLLVLGFFGMAGFRSVRLKTGRS